MNRKWALKARYYMIIKKMKFGILAAVIVENAVFWNVMPCI
jgi:hypothetical protein